MSNNNWCFLGNSESPEQSYSIGKFDVNELAGMLTDANEKSIELVPIWEAECSCIGVVPIRIAKLLVPFLNAQKYDILEPLSYKGDVLPADVIEIRNSNL